MRFLKPNEKRNMLLLFLAFVCIFSFIFIIVGVNFSVIWDAVKPIVYGFIIAVLMHPIIRFFEEKVFVNRKEKRIGFKHVLSVVIAYVIVITLVTLFAITAIPQIVSNYKIFVEEFENYIITFRNITADFVNSNSNFEMVYIFEEGIPDLKNNISEDLFSVTIRNLEGANLSAKSSSGIQEVVDIFDSILMQTAEMIRSYLPNFFSSAFNVLTTAKNLIIGFFVSIYMLLGERKHIKRIDFVLKGWLPKKIYLRVSWIISKCSAIFKDYIAVRMLDGIIIGVATYLLLLIFQMPNDLEMLLAVIMGVSSFFPFVGPVVGIISGALVLSIFDIRAVIVYLIVSLFVNLIDARYIEPLLVSERDEHVLPPIWIFASIIIMGGLFGIVGILIGIPLFSLIYAIVKNLSSEYLRSTSQSDDTRDYFVISESAHDMREYYDRRTWNRIGIIENARERMAKIKSFFKRKKKSKDSDEEDK